MKGLIVMPTYNERENVKIIIPEIFNLIPDIGIMIVDDNSPDGTAGEVEILMKKFPNLFILKRSEKAGLGNAYKAGFSKAIKEIDVPCVIMMDADGSHDPKYLKTFLEKINEYDVVVGSRYIDAGGSENWAFCRRMLSKFGNLYAGFFTGLKLSDLTAGFMCVRTDILKKVNFDNISATGYSFQIEFKAALIRDYGARATEVPIIFKERKVGESKISGKIVAEGFLTPVRIFIKRLCR